ncbi:MAG: rhodanese-like domain-containing protein [Myxococcota bacterium]
MQTWLMTIWLALANAASFEQMGVKAAAAAMQGGWTPFILDVRTIEESNIAKLANTDILIPHDELDKRLKEVPKDREILVYCHSGIRSARAAEVLKQNGYGRVVNLSGGIVDWAKQIDPQMKTY